MKDESMMHLSLRSVILVELALEEYFWNRESKRMDKEEWRNRHKK
jgi:hypothetical protein